ncbi:MAG TPA: hypothetical protein PKU74_06645, partial [Candidatus Omnitrophota bacterium]|nr:hypothetical protein [Candidatus Omnitrophota bacterium]
HGRLFLILALLTVGLLVQLMVEFWGGLFFLAAATALSLIKGYSAHPKSNGPEEWNQVTPDEYQKVQLKQKQLKKWDQDCFDITNPLGFFCAALCAGVGFLIWIGMMGSGQERLAGFWAWDTLVLFAPHWVTGVRSYLKKDQLIIKIKLLEQMMRFLSSPSDVHVLPMLATQPTKDGKRVPTDARLMLRFIPAPAECLGLQVQISINNVEGRDYPYLYCVLIGKSHKFFDKADPFIKDAPRNITLELKAAQDVVVLVIRQKTTRTSGYFTNQKAAEYVLKSALDISWKILAGPLSG